MSYICKNCNTVQPNGSKPTKVVLETEDVEYTDRNGEAIGWGFEIRKEIDACEPCVESLQPEEEME